MVNAEAAAGVMRAPHRAELAWEDGLSRSSPQDADKPKFPKRMEAPQN